jgi:hypothetical protein
MSAQQNYSGARYEPKGSESAQRLGDASRLILLNEYDSLLRTIEPVRLLNRGLLIAIVLLQFILGPYALLDQIPLLIATALASCFWFLQEFSTGRRLGRLGELIASTNGELATGMKDENTWPVTLPTLRKESLPQITPSAEAGESSSRVTPEQIWTDTYVSWRYEARKDRGVHILQRAEPIMWFGLAFAFGIYHVVLALR